jgi:quercetin dioxygenase-like cupin family protein
MDINKERVFALADYAHFSEEKATITEVVSTPHSSIAVWAVQPGQFLPSHIHPHGQDTWVMLQGTLTYDMGDGQSKTLEAGMVAIADQHQIHGARNEGLEDVIFVSIYSAPDIGYERA